MKNLDKVLAELEYKNLDFDKVGLYHVDGAEWNVKLEKLQQWLSQKLQEAWEEGRRDALVEIGPAISKIEKSNDDIKKKLK